RRPHHRIAGRVRAGDLLPRPPARGGPEAHLRDGRGQPAPDDRGAVCPALGGRRAREAGPATGPGRPERGGVPGAEGPPAPIVTATKDPGTAAVRSQGVRAALRDGTPVLIRPIRPGDKALLVDGFARLSEESRLRRFLSPM